MSSGGHIQPSFVGIVLTSRDALLLFTQAINGRIPMINRRPHDKERSASIASGNVFIYCEGTSSIKRWTDGVTWSPSRIMGNFLIYRELNKGFPPGEKKRAAKRKQSQDDTESGMDSMDEGLPPLNIGKDEERQLIGSLVDSYDFKKDGLVKKTISVRVNDQVYHLVSYYSLRHAVAGGLIHSQPSRMPGFAHVNVLDELLSGQNFRVAVDSQGSDVAGSNHNTPPPSSGSPGPHPQRHYAPPSPDHDPYGQNTYGLNYPSSPTHRYEFPREPHLSYETSTPVRSNYPTFMPSAGRNDDMGMYSQTMRDNIPRSQISPYPLPGSSDFPPYPDSNSGRSFSIGSGLHSASGMDGNANGGMHQGRSASYSAGHYGMTDPSSYATSGAPPMPLMSRGMIGHPLSGTEKNPTTGLIGSYVPGSRGHESENNEDNERPPIPFQSMGGEGSVSFNDPNWG
jgi:hypothetical protein